MEDGGEREEEEEEEDDVDDDEVFVWEGGCDMCHNITSIHTGET